MLSKLNNVRPIQSFIRLIESTSNSISSDTYIYAHPSLLCYVIPEIDKVLVNFHDSFENGTLNLDYMVEVYEKMKHKYENDEKKYYLSHDELSDTNENVYGRKEMDFNEIFQPKSQPIFYTFNEQEMILACNDSDFTSWFKNEIFCILEFMDRYRRDEHVFTFPTNGDELRRRAVITSTMDVQSLEFELQRLYERVILIYSLLFSGKISLFIVKKKLFKEVTFLKQLLFTIAEELDFRCARIYNYIVSCQKFFCGESQNLNKNLTDDLDGMEKELKEIERYASEFFELHRLKD
uniref:Uncharacterized protein n=1 Tax=Parastrongyloides trichosuri TaxID=131310 RepID=A0A0N4Z055_PARTI